MASNIELVKPQPGIVSLGIAMDMMYRAKPFSRWETKQLVGTVRGAIRRDHYLFLKEGDQYCGFACWGECTDEVGDAWSKGEAQPTYEQCSEGDCIVLFIVYMIDDKYMKEGFRLFREKYAGRRLYGRRHKGDVIRPVKLLFR